jgi:hypothetical protein
MHSYHTSVWMFGIFGSLRFPMNNLLGEICELTRGAFVWGIGAQQILPLRFPGLPVEFTCVGKLHAAFLRESRIRGRWRVPRSRKSGFAPVGMTNRRETLPLIVAAWMAPPNEQPTFWCICGSALSPGRLARESSFISHISPKAGEIPGFPVRGAKQSPRVRLSLRKAARGSSTQTRFTGNPGIWGTRICGAVSSGRQ